MNKSNAVMSKKGNDVVRKLHVKRKQQRYS